MFIEPVTSLISIHIRAGWEERIVANYKYFAATRLFPDP